MTLLQTADDVAQPAHRTFRILRKSEFKRIGWTALALSAAVISLAGCSNVDRAVATSAIPIDYHERHPVVLTDAPQGLDIFVSTGDHLDYRQQHDLEAFSSDFLTNGQGRIRVLMPRGGVNPRAAETTLTEVRRGLAASGVRGDIEVGSYRIADARLASVLHLSFVKLQAKIAAHCGDWPEDLGTSSAVQDWENRPYYNLGCANQQTLAAQVDDPRDLVRPRATEPGDVYIRTRSIQDLRGFAGAPKGQDPSTTWTQANLVPIGGAQ